MTMDGIRILCGTVVFLLVCKISSSCNSDWYPYNGTCYQASQRVFDVRMARRYCQIAGGDLAYVGSSSTLSALNLIPFFDGQRSYWLSENSTLNISTTSTVGCPYAKILDINYAECSEEKYFLCQTEMPTEKYTCPSSWNQFDSICFKAMTIQTTYKDAAQNCILLHGQLAVLDDGQKEPYAMATLIGKNETFLVGAKYGDGVFKWSNEKEFQPICGDLCKTNQTSGGRGECVGLQSAPEHPTVFTFPIVDCDQKYNFLCEVAATEVLTTIPTTQPTTPMPLICPHGYNWKSHQSSGFCFWETTYETDRMNWYQAREFCRLFGGDLASYHDMEEEEHGLGGAKGHYKGLWFGLKRREEDGVFHWTDGKDLNYTNWGYNEPNLKSRTKFCVAHGPGDSKWELDYCGVRRWFVCKAPKMTNPAMPDTDINKKTPCKISGSSVYRNQWWLYNDHCYLVHEESIYSWDTASTFCQDNGAHLASVHSFNETNFILSVASKSPDMDFWIGLSAQGLDSPYTWSDGTPLDFLYWADDESQNDTTGINTCATFNRRDGSWKMDHCNRLQGVICKRGVNATYEFTSPPPTPSLPGNCESGWYQLGNRCYKHFGSRWSRRTQWLEAKHACEKVEATLVSIHNQDEQDFLTDLVLEAGTEVWIGLQSLHWNTVFQWSDGSRMDYTNWNTNEPQFSSDDSGEELDPYGRVTDKCVFMDSVEESMGKWNDASCSLKKAFICQKMKDPSIEVPSGDPFMCSNITGWHRLGSSCYGFFEEQGEEASWLEAQRKCRSYEANLLTFRNAAVGIFLKRRLKRKNNFLWIGIRESAEDKYQVLFDRPVHYTNWMAGQPQKASTYLDNCVAMTSENHWLVKSCKEKHSFICEWTPDEYDQPEIEVTSACTDKFDSWEDLGGDSCYLFKMDLRYTWNDAMIYCFKHEGYLASFHNVKELALVNNYVKNHFSTSFIHIGLGKRKDGSYAWADHSPLDFTQWDDDEPNHPDFECVGMFIGGNGKWSDVDCDETHRGFMCSSRKVVRYKEPLTANSTQEQDALRQKLTIGGIFGIVICVLVILAVIGITVYYLRPWDKKEKLHEPELL